MSATMTITKEEFERINAMPEADRVAFMRDLQRRQEANEGKPIPREVQRELMQQAIEMAESAESNTATIDLDLADTVQHHGVSLDFPLEFRRGVTVGVISILQKINSPIAVGGDCGVDDVAVLLFCLCCPEVGTMIALAKSGELKDAVEVWAFDFGQDEIYAAQEKAMEILNAAIPNAPNAEKKIVKKKSAPRRTTRR